MNSRITINKYKSEWDRWIQQEFDHPEDPLYHFAIVIVNLAGEQYTGDPFAVWYRLRGFLARRIYSFKPIFDLNDPRQREEFTLEATEWAYEHAEDWLKVMTAYNTKYNPLENFNRHEHAIEEHDMNHPNSTTITASVAPETTEEFFNTGKSETTGGIGDKGNIETTRDTSGNVGVTTSQQMLQSEIDLRMQGIYNKIFIEPFVREFCIAVY